MAGPPPGGMPPLLGPGMRPNPPGVGMPPPMPGIGMPPGVVGGPPGVDPAGPPAGALSHVDLGMVDRDLLVSIDLVWSETVFRTAVAPRMMSAASQIKGKLAVFSSDVSWIAVAAAGPKALADPDRKAFPRGTVDRKSNLQRMGLEYPPVQRVSLFADLLPYMGRGQLAGSLNRNAAWFDKENLPSPGFDRAGAWVPELLVPHYPQSAWRAHSPYAPDYALGATNYVAIAGVGLDIPRADPADPKFKRKVGMTGYGWGSKAEEVTDGLSNTIYMMQTPPGLQQPWIAGGGATVRGFDDNDPMGGFKYPQPGRAKPGTYALMGDGSARFIPYDIDPKVLHALATRAGDDSALLADVDAVAPKVEPPRPAEPKAPEAKTPEEKKPADPKPEDKKAADPKAVDPKATDPKGPEAKKDPAKPEPAPAPGEKK
jgi:hypothetical protein